jgi:hypothetical protein
MVAGICMQPAPWARRRRGPGTAYLRPGGILEHDDVTVRILERDPALVPVRIRRRQFTTAVLSHVLNGGAPFGRVGKVENEEIFVCRPRQNRIRAPSRELEMVRPRRVPDDDTVEAGVIGE